MNLGKLNKRITIVTRGTLTKDGFVGYTESAETQLVVWGGSKQLSMHEKLQYGLQVGQAAYIFTFRYMTAKNITQANELIYEGDRYRVISINNIEEDKTIIEIVANTQTN